MIEQKAIVTRLGNGHVWLKAKQSGICRGCAQQSGCSTATLVKSMIKRELELSYEESLAIGDEVSVALEDSKLLLGSFLVYLIPLLIMLISVVTADALLSGSSYKTWLIPTSVISLSAGFRLTKFLVSKSRIIPRIGH